LAEEQDKHPPIDAQKLIDDKVREIAYLRKLEEIYNEGLAHRRVIAADWDGYIQFLRGKQWPKRRPSHKVSATINLLIENIERKSALLTDAKPIPKVIPRSDRFQDTADVLNILINRIFQTSDFGQAQVEMLEYAQLFGTGFIGTVFDESAANGLGDITTPAFDPRAVLIDPFVRKSYLLHQGEFVILEDIWALDKARDLYPKRADRFKADEVLSRYSNSRTDAQHTWWARIFHSPDQDVRESYIPRVSVREYWLRDYSGEFRNNMRKTVLVGDVIADDGENPYNDGGFPIEMLSWHTDFNTAWGWGDVELLRSPQEVYNKILASIVENIILMQNAIWIGDADALTKEEWRKLTNAPGSYVRKRPGRELRREPGVPLPSDVYNTLGIVEGTGIEKTTGMVDVMRGVRTGQVSSGVGIESLQLMAQALIRLRARAIEALHVRLGKKLVSRIFQFYEPEKIAEVLLAKGEESETLQALNTDLLKPISRRDRNVWKDFAFEVEPGSGLALAETQKRIESFRLREIGVIDDRALLEDLKYPHREKVLKRVEAMRQNAANEEIPPGQDGGSPQGSRATQFPNQAGASPKGRF